MGLPFHLSLAEKETKKRAGNPEVVKVVKVVTDIASSKSAKCSMHRNGDRTNEFDDTSKYFIN